MRTIQTLSQNGFMLHEGLTEYPKGTSRYLNSSQASGGENSGYTPGKRTFMNPKEVSELLLNICGATVSYFCFATRIILSFEYYLTFHVYLWCFHFYV